MIKEMPATNSEETVLLVKETIQKECETLSLLIGQFSEFSFIQSIKKVISAILDCSNRKGRIILTGVGKSGHIAQKSASTFSSTGTPSVFIHPTELLHGDLGNILSNDLIILIGKSGESLELNQLIPHFKSKGCITVAITASLKSTLAQNVQLVLHTPVTQEACPLDLAPTSSTTSALALLDGLAMACMSYRKFTPEQFSIFHPGGQLGKRLLTEVRELMIPISKCPILNADSSTVENVMQALDSYSLGVVLLTSKSKFGIFTDGDLRRNLLVKKDSFFKANLYDLVNFSPYSLPPQTKVNEAIQFMEKREKPLNLVLVKSDQGVEGILRLHELLK